MSTVLRLKRTLRSFLEGAPELRGEAAGVSLPERERESLLWSSKLDLRMLGCLTSFGGWEPRELFGDVPSLRVGDWLLGLEVGEGASVGGSRGGSRSSGGLSLSSSSLSDEDMRGRGKEVRE